ncbi:MAG TPA: hypothetical protein VF766_09365 [Pyrinomonadaceae bacterium]
MSSSGGDGRLDLEFADYVLALIICRTNRHSSTGRRAGKSTDARPSQLLFLESVRRCRYETNRQGKSK